MLAQAAQAAGDDRAADERRVGRARRPSHGIRLPPAGWTSIEPQALAVADAEAAVVEAAGGRSARGAGLAAPDDEPAVGVSTKMPGHGW